MKTHLAKLAAAILIVTLVHVKCYGDDTKFVEKIVLTGVSSGGLLTVDRPTFGATTLFVTNTHGDTAEIVIARLADKINQSWRDENRVADPSAKIVSYSGNALELPALCAEWATAGTEHGFGIPQPPKSISGYYNVTTSRLVLFWKNPVRPYDQVALGAIRSFPGDTTNCALNLQLRSENLGGNSQCFYVYGKTRGVPSSVGLIDVSAGAQEELSPFVFYDNVMPNWSSWTDTTLSGQVVYEQGIRPEYVPTKNPNFPSQKAFYQIIKTKNSGIQGGIWRQFLGLRPEHKYRVYVRLNTLAMDKSTNDWSLSFHVAVNSPNGAELSTDQLAGKSPLPDGTSGPMAGQMIHYGPDHTTQGTWVKSSADIILSNGVDTITTWLRHSGKDSTGVGMDWIKVEDLGAVIKNDKAEK